MRILALETSGVAGSVALADDGNVLAETTLAGVRRSTQTLAPSIQTLLTQCGWRPADLEGIALPIGPGSFTGLRLGAATAKMLAYVTGAKVLGLDTLQVIAAQAPERSRELCVLLDAGRGELLVGHFRFVTDGNPETVSPTVLVKVADWLLAPPMEVQLIGPGLRGLVGRLPAGMNIAPEVCWEPRAATVAKLAAREFAARRWDDPWTLAPVYYRRSAAEEVWERKQR